MEKRSILISALLLFAGISAFDIHPAAKQHDDKEDTFLSKKTDFNFKKLDLLWAVIKNNDCEISTLLLEKNVSIPTEVETNQKAEEEVNKLLWDGFLNSNFIKIELALQKGANVNHRNQAGETVLMRAALDGHINMVELLLKYDANVNIKDEFNNTALINASKNHYIKNTQSLSEKKFELLIKDTMEIYNNIAKLLLEKGADVNARDNFSRPAITWAARINNPELVKLLLECGADVNIKDNMMNLTTMQYFEKNPELQKVYNEYCNKQLNELIELARENNFKKIKEILIKFPHLINQTNKYKETLLNVAILFGRFDLIIQLFEHPAIIIKPDLTGDILSETHPISYAEKLGSPNLDHLNYGVNPKKAYSDPKKVYRDIALYLKEQRKLRDILEVA